MPELCTKSRGRTLQCCAIQLSYLGYVMVTCKPEKPHATGSFQTGLGWDASYLVLINAVGLRNSATVISHPLDLLLEQRLGPLYEVFVGYG